MMKHTKSLLSAIVSAALCTSSIPLHAVNAQIVIDHNSGGIESDGNSTGFAFQFEEENNDAAVAETESQKYDYTAEDLNKLRDFILGKSKDISADIDYDVNSDGVWDSYDLCLMRKTIAKEKAENYVKPDRTEFVGFGYDVISDDLPLYLGPGENYEQVTVLPRGTHIIEEGFMSDTDSWMFTVYNGQYGWVSTSGIEPSKYLDNGYSFAFGKPVIYLYPQQETDVHVELELTSSELYSTYPKYNDGWDVTAYPDGTLLNKADGSHHKYLFWESVNASTRFDFSKGFCVAGSDIESFLKEKLAYMGLTEEEMNEFIVYWMPKMEHNAYNLVTFQGDIYTDAARLDITPKPDSLLRVFMAYVPLENAVDIEPQQLDTFERKGFTVVEWGGSEIRQ